MAMKSRVLTVTKKAKLKTLAEKLSTKIDCHRAVDIIPPAYTCDRERLVIIVVTLAKNMPDDVRRFIQDLSRDKAQNVAFIADGAPELMAPIMEIVKAAGTNAIDDVLYVNGGSALPFFGAKLSSEEETAAFAWCDKILAELK